jgi:hypothetical protein
MNTGECVEISKFIPEFISELIKSELSANLWEILLFNNIFEALKKNYRASHDILASASLAAGLRI